MLCLTNQAKNLIDQKVKFEKTRILHFCLSHCFRLFIFFDWLLLGIYCSWLQKLHLTILLILFETHKFNNINVLYKYCDIPEHDPFTNWTNTNFYVLDYYPVNPGHHLDVTVISQTPHMLTSQMWDNLDITVISKTSHLLTSQMWHNLDITVISQTPHLLTSQMWDNLDVTVISQTPHMLTSQKWCLRDVTEIQTKMSQCDMFVTSFF